jgi:hypothetical protein
MRAMSARGVVGIAVVIVGSLSGLVGALVNVAMIDKVNARLPKEQQFSYFGRSAQRMLRLWREYRRLFPDGKLHVVEGTLAAAALACVLCVAWALGFF